MEVSATILLAGPGDLPVVLQGEEPVALVGIPEEKIHSLAGQRDPGLVAAVEPQPGSTVPTRSWRWRVAVVAGVVPEMLLREPALQVAAAKADPAAPLGVLEPAAEVPTTAGAEAGVGVAIQQGVRAEVCESAGITTRVETAGMPE
jgi:transcriptional regulator of nitric oxide reductase